MHGLIRHFHRLGVLDLRVSLCNSIIIEEYRIFEELKFGVL